MFERSEKTSKTILSLTVRELRSFALCTVLLTSVFVGAIDLAHASAPAAHQVASADICSAAKYFR